MKNDLNGFLDLSAQMLSMNDKISGIISRILSMAESGEITWSMAAWLIGVTEPQLLKMINEPEFTKKFSNIPMSALVGFGKIPDEDCNV